MPIYDVYVHCDQCGQPHPVNLKLTLDDPNLNQANVGELYAGKVPPSGIALCRPINTAARTQNSSFPPTIWARRYFI